LKPFATLGNRTGTETVSKARNRSIEGGVRVQIALRSAHGMALGSAGSRYDGAVRQERTGPRNANKESGAVIEAN